MNWDCCTPDGRCQQAAGCPAGGACHGQPGCADAHCPGHPGQRVARIKASRPVQAPRIDLDGTRAAPWPSARKATVKRVGEWLLALVLVVIWAMVSTAVRDADEAATDPDHCDQPTTAGAHSARKTCTHWSKQA